MLAEVMLNRPLRNSFTYRVPPSLHSAISLGKRVVVPFGKKREVGVCVELPRESKLPEQKLRDIDRVLDAVAILDTHLLDLTRWVAEYYICSWGEALAAVLPPALKRESERKTTIAVRLAPQALELMPSLEKKSPQQFRMLRWLREAGGPVELPELLRRTGLTISPYKTLLKKELVLAERVPLLSEPIFIGKPQPSTLQLNEAQQSACNAIQESITAKRFEPFLLFGVTGSGKTEVYLRAMEAARKAGRGAIILVPEISLTPQTVERFCARFPDVAVLHSHLTDSQRLAEWTRIREGKANVVVGARSAVFAPVPDLGLIIVDEEHEPSFKQQNSPRYHARDVAVYRAQLAKAVVVLGSATPSLESYRNAVSGKYRLLSLPERVMEGNLPAIHLVDLKQEMAEQKSFVVISRLLKNKLETVLRRGEQAILFLNRRGFSPVLFCRECGGTMHCRRCDVSLTYHRKIQRMLCHSCCEELPPTRQCQECGSPSLLYLGAGSERVETVLKELFPQARVARMDSDTMTRRGSYEEVLGRFREGQIDLLVGTQMIAKGLDFPNVTLVGVISADGSLHIPDFRASERTFQLISQVSGRAGRGPKGGEVVVQSAMEGHEAIRMSIEHDFLGFAKRELEHRRSLRYPPFGRLVRILFEGANESKLRTFAMQTRAKIEAAKISGVECLGPAAAPIARLRNRHRWHLLLKISPPELYRELRSSLHAIATKSIGGVKLAIDVDPVSLL